MGAFGPGLRRNKWAQQIFLTERSGVRSELHRAQTPTVLDHSRTVPQGDGRAGPAFTRRAVGGECNLIVLDAGDVLDNAFAVGCPGIDAES
jgi:hypothetical protein